MSKIAVIGIIGNSVFLPVDEFHRGGETVEASSVHFEPGGKGFNQAVAAARCGAQVSFLAAVGREFRGEFSDFLTREITSHATFPTESRESLKLQELLQQIRNSYCLTSLRQV